MAEKKKKKRRRGGGGIGGGRWGVNFQEAAMAAGADWVGKQVNALLPEATPAFIKGSSITALGLYGIGVIMRNRSFRSIGAGLAVGQAFIT